MSICRSIHITNLTLKRAGQGASGNFVLVFLKLFLFPQYPPLSLLGVCVPRPPQHPESTSLSRDYSQTEIPKVRKSPVSTSLPSQWSFEFKQVFIKNLHFETGIPLEEAHTHGAVGQTGWLTQGSSWMGPLGSWGTPEDRVSSSECDRRGPVNEANGEERHFSLRMSVHTVQNFTDVVKDQGYLMINCILSFIMINWMWCFIIINYI